MFQQPRHRPEANLEQVLKGIGDVVNRIRHRMGAGNTSGAIIGLLVIVILVWLSTGVYTVDPSERGALRTFGKFTGTSEPGLHWFWPSPIGTRNVEQVTNTRRMELGFLTRESGGVVDAPDESLMITGDENIVDVQMVVQYRIKDLGFFLFKVDDPGEAGRGVAPGRPEGRTLKDIAEVALRQVVGSRPIDDVLTVEKETVQSNTRAMMQTLLDDYETGIMITEVKLQNVRPPAEVQDAFEDVVRAKEDKETIINQSQAYALDILPRARGDAEKTIKAAEGFRAERIEKATGEASRFLSVLKEYEKAPVVTRQRLFLEAMEEVLPDVTKFIIAPDAGGGLLQFLPLEAGILPPKGDK